MKGLKRILFPTDFSSNADHALLHAIRLADFNEGELIVQHVVSDYFEQHPHWSALFGVHQLQTELDGYVESRVLPILEKSRENIRITKVVSKGDPAVQIASLADKEFVDLVIMGSADGVRTNSVMRLTRRPVLAVSMYSDARPGAHTHKIKTILVATDFSPYSRKVVNYAFGLKRVFDATVNPMPEVDHYDLGPGTIAQAHKPDEHILVQEYLDCIDHLDPWLVLKGLKIIYERNVE